MPSNKEIFFKAVYVKPPLLCGRWLKPFSLSHSYFLSYIKNPYIVGGAVTDADLLTAVYVCSLTHDELQEYISSPKWFKSGLWFALWGMSKLSTAHESFAVYMSEYFDVPDHFEPVPVDENETPPVKEERSGYSGPWQYHLVHILCREYGMTLDEAWNTGVTTARCYYDIWSESTGYDNTLVSVDIGQPLLEKP